MTSRWSDPDWRRYCADVLDISFSMSRFKSVPAKGVSFVVSLAIILGSGRRACRMDARSHLQARHRGFRPADVLDGARQGSEDRMGVAAAGALSGSSGGCAGADPDHRAEVLVPRLDRFRDPHHGRSRQGALLLHLRCQSGASLVLDADRGRSGVAPSDRFRTVDFHGGQRLIVPAPAIPIRDIDSSPPYDYRPRWLTFR